MKRKGILITSAIVVLVLVSAFGFALERIGGGVSESPPIAASSASTQDASMQQGTPAASAGAAKATAAARTSGVRGIGAPTASGSAAPATHVAQPMIVTTASLSLQVKDVQSSVDALRTLASRTGSQVSDLTYEAGTPQPDPTPLASGGGNADAGSAATQPSSAQVTLRVPAARLDEVTRAATALGVVIAQTATQSDVTAQHVDMAARLKNLRAEEARLRALFSRAGGVSDLLEVEQQLSDVRGEIESAQAQLAYLDGQVAMSTLRISLTQPGSVVRPASGISWGLADAVTLGVQSAAAVVRAFVTGVIALAPVALLVLIAWLVVTAVRRLLRKVFGIGEPSEVPLPEE